MKLLSLHIENFGTLRDFDFHPEAGLNILYQKNGWGKSTLAVFIKAMLYGLPASTKRSLDENERKKYTPWQGGAFGGSLEFSSARGSFRVERFFGAKESMDSFALFDLATNKPSDAYTEALGEELFGIDADGFERSTYLSQRLLSGGRDNNSITAKLGNLLDDVGDVGNYDDAIAALDKRRRHYVMTGNRGLIADLTQERVDLQSELERVRSIGCALNAQEDQLAQTSAQLEASRALLTETRERLEKAGLARERAALVAQKKAMEQDLENLRARHSQTDRFFRGATPTVEEWRSYCELYEGLKEAKSQRKFFATVPQGIDRLKALRKTFAQGVPTETILSRMSQDTDTVQEFRARMRALHEREGYDAPIRRFPNGAPSEKALEQAKTRLQRVSVLQKNIRELERVNAEPVRGWMLPTGIGVVALGILLAILSLLPVLSGAMLPLLIVGGIAAIAGGVLGILGWRKRSAMLSMIQRNEERARACRKESESEMRNVSAFLREYGMADGDPVAALTELSLLSSRYRDTVAELERAREEMKSINERISMITERLRVGLSRYRGALDVSDDYRPELEILRKEVTEYLQLESAEQKRLADLADAESRVKSLTEELRVFLIKYDPMETMTAGDCLQYIGEQRAERSRLTREIAQKENALNHFIAEKKLTGNVDVACADDYDRLRGEESELQRRIEELQRKAATLKSSIERLTPETDRIPELEARVVQIADDLSEAKANSATVAHTQKFLEEAKTALSTRYLDGMQAAFRKYFELLTDGQAPESIMDTSFEVSLREGGKTRAMESFSRGWRDAVDFCIRLSLTGALYADGEKPFLLLDDPFVNLDDNRLDAAKSMLEQLAKEYQIFYFVCHKERV